MPAATKDSDRAEQLEIVTRIQLFMLFDVLYANQVITTEMFRSAYEKADRLTPEDVREMPVYEAFMRHVKNTYLAAPKGISPTENVIHGPWLSDEAPLPEGFR